MTPTMTARNFIQMMRPLLGLPKGVRSLKIDAEYNGVVIVDVSMIAEHQDAKASTSGQVIENKRYRVTVEVIEP